MRSQCDNTARVVVAAAAAQQIGALDASPTLRDAFALSQRITTRQQPTPQSWSEITTRYELKRLVGYGMSGFVVAAVLRRDPNESVAIKFQQLRDNTDRENAVGEMRLQRLLTTLFVDNGLDTKVVAPIVKEYDHALVRTTIDEIVNSIDDVSARADTTNRLGQYAREQLAESAKRANVPSGVGASLSVEQTIAWLFPTKHATFALSVMEYVRGPSLYTLLRRSPLYYRNGTAQARTTKAVLAQALCSEHMLNALLAFTHFDFHDQNIMCEDRSTLDAPVLRFALAVDTVAHIDTRAECEGLVTKLADFGNSYVELVHPRIGVHMSRQGTDVYPNDVPLLAVGMYNPSFDMQRLATGILQTLVSDTSAFDEHFDVELLEVLIAMLDRDVSTQRDARVDMVQAHTALLGDLRALYTQLRSGAASAAKTTPLALHTRIIANCEHIRWYPFRHDTSTHAPTARDVLARCACFKRFFAFDTRLLANRVVYDLSLNIGDFGSATQAPWNPVEESNEMEVAAADNRNKTPKPAPRRTSDRRKMTRASLTQPPPLRRLAARGTGATSMEM
jgi:serine/threonine protein kinase